jgi:tRNA (mo5U34)-methyltransferase
VGFWWHSINLGHGVTTNGFKTTKVLAEELDAIALPDVRGKTVLDVGAWDGFFAFEAERRGAARVAALDYYMWAMDIPGQQRYWRECMQRGVAPRPYHETEFWHPDTLPGKVGFDTARRTLGSRVEPIVADFATCDPEAIGQWDIVLFLGVLYHLPDPLGALDRLAKITRALAIIETEAMVIPGQEDVPLWRLFPGAELNGDISNWWVPNIAGLTGACSAAGFASTRMTSDSARPDDGHYRPVVHAVKY